MLLKSAHTSQYENTDQIKFTFVKDQQQPFHLLKMLPVKQVCDTWSGTICCVTTQNYPVLKVKVSAQLDRERRGKVQTMVHKMAEKKREAKVEGSEVTYRQWEQKRANVRTKAVIEGRHCITLTQLENNYSACAFCLY